MTASFTTLPAPGAAVRALPDIYVPATAFAPNVLLAVLASRSGQDPCNVAVRHRARATGTPSIRPTRIGRIMLRCLAEMVGFRCGPFWRFKP